MKLKMLIEEENPPFIFLKGNLSEGFEAYGPYRNFDEASAAHEFEEGWVMVLDVSGTFKMAKPSDYTL
jgi:hypothetical protein